MSMQTKWMVTINGLVRRPFRLTLNELKQRRKRTVEAVHACVGSPLAPEVPQRRVVNVVWGVVALDELLDEARVESQATFVWSYDLDYGEFYGTTSDSYLRMTRADRRADGPFVTTFYNDREPGTTEDGGPRLRPAWDIAPESVMKTVEVSVDGGDSWVNAELAARAGW